ncbi:hypothetical protein GLOTRDRAFT_70328 [Gloeophyllum trabeum ATCC 11539]|uniref:Velvet domain-containing protein n=1 Tax=Gloeophyllum trabeum (strain ATCC 11539 / FP-39264 / Madison 617) TaxID=670483 RepID=S7QH73_GLOTA|nr:uncharacterized protein GLOTRDRAFT_70328 [Gloeophyllum trabeum ATCC 11539]EPQ59151.1 hypothetical protein GLOTRDRAFT_70328 [Gloeophyllum trabeum ATCC 11539]
MIVRNPDNSIVDVDDIDYTFFVVTVDLWSSDAKQEMNLVLHPSSSDRYQNSSSNNSANTSPNGPKSRRRNATSGSAAAPRSEEQSPVSGHSPLTPSATNGSSTLPPPPTSDVRETSSWGHPPPPPDPYPSQAYASPTTHSAPPNYDPNAPPVMYASASAAYAQHVQSSSTHAQYHQASYPTNPAPAPPPTVPLPRHTYTRTLVGPLAANACRLVDEHRKPGIFFLFQDLSIRTEGTFRLRLRLMNIGAPPAPDPGSTRVHNSHSPILAQTFTEPFTVYSAKRFPGVPDTTPLSIAFGNQGQKLPLRNRHGPSKGGRKRRRGGESEGSDDDSDG